MSKLKENDIVVNMATNNWVKEGAIGIVLERWSSCPLVEWEPGFAIKESMLLINKTSEGSISARFAAKLKKIGKI